MLLYDLITFRVSGRSPAGSHGQSQYTLINDERRLGRRGSARLVKAASRSLVGRNSKP